MHSMLAHWVPPLERSKFAAIVYAGNLFAFDRQKVLEDTYDIFLRCEFRNCRLVTSERLAMFLRIMGRLASCILSVRWPWPRVVCILVDIHL